MDNALHIVRRQIKINILSCSSVQQCACIVVSTPSVVVHTCVYLWGWFHIHTSNETIHVSD